MAEELEPLWLAALLLRVPEAFIFFISLPSARSACGLTVLGRTNLAEILSLIGGACGGGFRVCILGRSITLFTAWHGAFCNLVHC
jgi:hypothetical protein